MTETKKDIEINNENGLLAEEIIKKVKMAANYCYNCNRCVTICPLSHVGLFSPRDLINDLVFLSIEEVMEKHNIWECLTCGQCTVVCPMTQGKIGVNIPELVLELRQLTSHQANQLEKCQQCETHDGIFPLISEIMVENPNPPNKLGFLEGTGLKTSSKGDIAYFIGCLPIMEDIIFNLEINYTNIPKAIIGLLNEAGISPVVLNEKCCGHDLLWSKGDLSSFKKLAEYNVQLYRDAGVKTIITGCAEGYRTWKIDYPKVVKDFDFEVYHFTEYLLKEKILETIRFPSGVNIKVTYHDACRMGRLGDKLYDPPRKILEQIPGITLIEMKNIKDDALCCGVSAFSCCNEYTKIIRKMRIEEAFKTGAEYLVVPCPKCLTHFNCFLSEPMQSKKINIKIIDIASLIGELLYFLNFTS